MLMINAKVEATLIIALITFHEFHFWANYGFKLPAANENRSGKN